MRSAVFARRLLIPALLVCGILAPAAQAGLSTFQPGGGWSLDHNHYYTWGINWSVPAGEQVTSVTFTFANLDNWVQPDPFNHLYIRLLDSAYVPAGESSWVTSHVDYEAASTDAFAGQGILIADYTDLAPGEETLTWTVPGEALAWIADGNFGIGIDPDCVYVEQGTRVAIATSVVVPSPAAALLCVVGTTLVAVGRRRYA